MSQVNKKAKSSWDDKPKGVKGNKLQSSSWESASVVFWFLVGIIGAACNFIIKNKRSIVDFCYNVMILYSGFNPSKNKPRVNNRRQRSKK